MKRKNLMLILLMLMFCSVFGKEILIGTTTSLDDTGFLNEISKEFKGKNGIILKWIAKGTGEALELGKRGDVDLLFVHDPTKEEKFISDGFGKARHSLMYNYFIMVASKDLDTTTFSKNLNELLKKIKEENIVFLSRGDNSGTYSKEKSIWKSAEIEPKFKNYKETGLGMAKTLQMTSELNGITLSDNGTFYSVEKKFNLKEIPLENAKNLKNTYSILELSNVSLEKQELINEFIKFMKSSEVKIIIENYGKEKYNHPLFNNIE